MESGTLNLDPAASEKFSPNPSYVESGTAPKDALLEQSESDVRRLRMQVNRQEDEREAQTRRTQILYIILGVVIVFLVVALWVIYPTLQDQKNSVSSFQTAANSLNGRFNSVEDKVDRTAALTSRIDKLQSSLRSSLLTAGAEAQAAAAKTSQRLRADVNQAIHAIQTRMAGLESNQHEAGERVTQLQTQIAGLKSEIATMREESSKATERISQLQNLQQSGAGSISNLDKRTSSNRAAIDSLSNRVDRKRIDFGLEKRRTEEIAPEIYLTIRRADTGKQEVDGTLQLSASSRMMAIRSQGIQKPVIFYNSADPRPMELVFTQVAKDQVSGYVIVPASPLTTASSGDVQ